MWHLGVGPFDEERHENAKPLNRVEGVEVEPLVFQRTPERLDHRVGIGNIDLCEDALQAALNRVASTAVLMVSMPDAPYRQILASSGRAQLPESHKSEPRQRGPLTLSHGSPADALATHRPVVSQVA
jgi:hypothetical protein